MNNVIRHFRRRPERETVVKKLTEALKETVVWLNKLRPC